MRGSGLRAVVMVSVALGAGCDFPLPTAIGGHGPDASPDAPLVPPAAGPSCQGLSTTCGQNRSDSCCNPGSAVVGGTYYRSYDVAVDSSSGDQRYPATVSTFWLDKYEVTVGRFRAFVNANKGTQASPPANGSGAHAAIAGSGWNMSWDANLTLDKAELITAVKCSPTYQTWTDIPGANEARPMNCITWYEAMAFCIWDGGYLPTEAEWNYAAAGGNEQRAYPWSIPAGSLELTASRASYSDGTDCVGDGMPGCAVTDLVQVGSKPMGDGRWGQSELAGNVWEWTLDLYGAYISPCVDCASTSSGTHREFRGGGFRLGASQLRVGNRANPSPPPPTPATARRVVAPALGFVARDRRIRHEVSVRGRGATADGRAVWLLPTRIRYQVGV